MTAELAMQAVKNVCLNVKITESIILQSDLGIPYTGKIFEDYLALKGNSVLKREEINHHKYNDFN